MGSAMNDVFDTFPNPQRCAADVVTTAELGRRLATGRPMRIKYGVDVTAPFLHIGPAIRVGKRRWYRITFGG
jgi:tyrosyl-tRNA synthetase